MLVDMGIDSYFGAPLMDSEGKVFGIVSVMETKPMELSSWIAPVLAVFASRVSVEALRLREERDARSREKTLEREVTQAQRFEALGRLGSSVAHDFNNLLSVILMNTEELLHMNLPESTRQHLQEIVTAGDHAQSLSKRLLAFGRNQELRPSSIELNEAIRSQLDVLARLAGGSVRVVCDLNTEPLYTVMDRGEFHQILLNLVVNARDAMPRGGQILRERDRSSTSQPAGRDSCAPSTELMN
jgi:signal transduction histidine kinase